MNCQGTAFETAANIMNPLAQRNGSSRSDDFDRILADANKMNEKRSKVENQKTEKNDTKDHTVKNDETKKHEEFSDLEKRDIDEEEILEIDENSLGITIGEPLVNEEREGLSEQKIGQSPKEIVMRCVESKRNIESSTRDILVSRIDSFEISENIKSKAMESAEEPAVENEALKSMKTSESGIVTDEGSMNLFDPDKSDYRAYPMADKRLWKQDAAEGSVDEQGKQTGGFGVRNAVDPADGKTEFEMDKYLSDNKDIVPEEMDISTETNKVFQEESGAEIKELEQHDLESSAKNVSGSENASDFSGNVVNGMVTRAETNMETGEKQELSKVSLVDQMSKSMETGTDGDKSFIRINLKPHWFGEMSIDLVKSPEGITARISAQKDVVGSLLADSSNEIAALFEEKNLKVENIVIEARESSEQQGYYSGGGREGFNEGSDRGFNQGRNGYGNMEQSDIIKEGVEEASAVGAQDKIAGSYRGKGINIIV